MGTLEGVGPAWADGAREIYCGDAWALAGQLPENSLDQIITSPPYWGLRSYLPEEHSDKPDEFGLEPHPSEYIAKLVDLFERLRPALKQTATVWLNLGDSYFGAGGGCDNQTPETKHRQPKATRKHRPDGQWLRPKQLLLIPSRAAIALQDAGWLLRNDMLWRKPNPMPSSVRDRLSCTYEHVFLFVKEPRYYFDLDAVREGYAQPDRKRGPSDTVGGASWNGRGQHSKGGHHDPSKGSSFSSGKTGEHQLGRSSEQPRSWSGGKNPGDVREWPTQAFPGSHFAVFPSALPAWCLDAGCPNEVCVECGKPKVRVVEAVAADRDDNGRTHSLPEQRMGKSPPPEKGWQSKRTDLGFHPTCSCEAETRPGLVLDPFLGSGTTLCVAKEKGLRGIGFELSPEYAAMAGKRIDEWKRPKEAVKAEAAGQLTLLEDKP